MNWTPSNESDGTIPSAESAIAQAVGAGSVCWEDMSNTGVFKSEEAHAIVEGLLKFLAEHHGLRAPAPKPEGHGWKPLDASDA